MRKRHLFVRYNKKHFKLPYDEIKYVKALKKYVKIITTKKIHLLQMSMTEVESQLPDDQFCRIHRSYIVSLEHTTEFDHELVKVAGVELPIGNQYKNGLLAVVDVLFGKQKDEAVLLDEELEELAIEITEN